jgi:hypothetical protein
LDAEGIDVDGCLGEARFVVLEPEEKHALFSGVRWDQGEVGGDIPGRQTLRAWR